MKGVGDLKECSALFIMFVMKLETAMETKGLGQTAICL